MASTECPFCDVAADRVVAGNAHALAIRDAFPVNPGHTLVVPRRHVSSWFESSSEERLAMFALLDRVRLELDEQLRPDGYNIGINVEEAGGQTVMHLHVHLIPRFKGDVDDPAGGVRFVLPERGNYRCPGRIPRTRE
jgi:diadenosine tetraphosphate (Ap4A) HIT family hydrolase